MAKRVLLDDCFHIDPVGCKDVDDVLCFTSENGKRYVTITIADVSSAVPEGHPLDIRAAKICQTLYQDGVAPKPMFPPLMSEGQLSLLKGCKKPGLSLKVCLYDLSVSWFESAVNVTQTFDYDTINVERDLVYDLKMMSSAFGMVSEDSHEWIESAMKFYNVEAAKLLKKAGVGVLRSHSAPDLERYENLDPSLSFLAMSSATYVAASSENTRHWGLNEDAYCHVTSPIRRYADLINQRCLKKLLFGSSEPVSIDYDRLNAVSKAAKQHDRDLVFLKAIKKERTGQVVGKIVEIRDKGDDIRKLSIYVAQWAVIVKMKYKRGPDPKTVLSKDELSVIPVSLGEIVHISYHSNLTARCWKRRMVLKLS